MATCGELSPNVKNMPCSALDRPGPCRCINDSRHEDDHQCRCGDEWPSRTQRELVDLIERATVVEVRPGDLLLFEASNTMTDAEIEHFETAMRDHISSGIRVAVLEHVRFAAVIRHEHAKKPHERSDEAFGLDPEGGDTQCRVD